jgi:hypothetical protein
LLSKIEIAFKFQLLGRNIAHLALQCRKPANQSLKFERKNYLTHAKPFILVKIPGRNARDFNQKFSFTRSGGISFCIFNRIAYFQSRA